MRGWLDDQSLLLPNPLIPGLTVVIRGYAAADRMFPWLLVEMDMETQFKTKRKQGKNDKKIQMEI